MDDAAGEAEVVIIGVGNTLLRDEGIGVHIVHELEKRSDLPPNVKILDYGMTGLAVVHAIANRRKAIFIDCAKMEEPPGTIRQFTPAEVKSIKYMPGFSLHEGDLLQALTISEQMGEAPDEVILYGIEPEQVEPGEELSQCLLENLSYYQHTILSSLTF